MNNRANIMYFLEHLCDMAARESHHDYVRMMQRDVLRIVDAVAPEDGSGAANVKVVRKVLQGLQQKNHLLAQTVTEIEECLKERDTLPEHVGLSSPVQPDDTEMGGMDGANADMTVSQKVGKQPVAPRLDKKQIEQRIEEDRERHKRLREHQWAIPADEEDAEFYQLLEETSSIGSDDYRVFEEEAMQREECAKEHYEEMDAMFAAQSTQNGE
jgi:CTD kinase subunit gamma